MPSEVASNNSLISIAIASAGSSLMDILSQQSCETTDQLNTVTAVQYLNSPVVSIESMMDTENSKLSTLFSTTGRERNSTGPLKQWLYEHQDHPYPTESEKQMLMTKTKMTSAQITIWFTNARVKMRKEHKLPVKINGKRQKKNEKDDLHELKKILDLSFSSEDETSDSTHSNDKRICIAYSCLNSEQITNLQRFAMNHSDQVALCEQVDNCTTHLIIGNEEQPLLCPLTMKLFQAIARHLFIMSYQWINECLQHNQILNEMKYEIRGDIPFGEYHDGMRKSRLAKQMKLFHNCQFFLLCDGCQDKMSKVELASLIQLCHGSILNTFPLTSSIESSMLTIVLCTDLFRFQSSNEQQLFELSRSNGVHFLGPEWILESIVQFALQPFEAYEQDF
ncbi:unnamed protein product [Adineta ricciae]|uniref:Uncharacterized protein n=1 Tax=Adineta ricciae TaxID=249248 RepID=A0A815UBD2_ADIRI|nr:unnamed protein product [Adineta ricciae]CAF1518471.1 unnamed protein product [Adineta ricciae]